jgi:Gpi18-like mannosyltransferase
MNLSYSLSDPVTIFCFLLGLFGILLIVKSLAGFWKKLENFLKDKISCNLEYLFFLACIVLGLIARYRLINVVSSDFSKFLSKWYDYININGLAAYRYIFTDYMPLYLYTFFPFTFFDIEPLFVPKIISFVFEIALCVWSYLIIIETTWNKKTAILVAGVCFILPLVILNGSYWGQADYVYASFVLGAIYFLMKRRGRLALILLGVACSIKLQSCFILPLFVIIYFKGNVLRFSFFLWIPIMYFLFFMPSLLLGFPPQEIFHAVLHQLSSYQSLNNGASNLYALFNKLVYERYFVFVLSLAFSIIGYVSYLIFKNLQKFSIIPPSEILACGLIITLTVVFFLPKMHERYFAVPEILSLLYAFTYKRNWYVCPLIILAGLIGYLHYISGSNTIIMPLYVGGILNATALFLLYQKHLTKSV